MSHIDQNYAAVQSQITQLLDEAAQDKNPATAILRSLLLAEMYDRNERSHQRAIEARTGIVQALEQRIQQMQARTNWREEIRKWRDEEETAIAYIKHGTVSIPPKWQQKENTPHA